MVAIAARYDIHCAAFPLPGVRPAADVALALPIDGGFLAAIIDPVGQGDGAAAVARRGAEVVSRSGRLGVGAILTEVHHALADSTGVSLAVARLQHGVVEFAGIGRGYGAVARAGAREPSLLVGSAGTVGVGLPRQPDVATVEWRPGHLLILAADGPLDCWHLPAARGATDLALPALMQRLAGPGSRLPEDASIVLVREPR